MAKHSASKKVSSTEPKSTESDPIDLSAALGPIAIIGASFLARKAAEVIYKSATGNPPPKASDPDAKVSNVLTWTLAVASVVALTEIAVNRLLPNKK